MSAREGAGAAAPAAAPPAGTGTRREFLLGLAALAPLAAPSVVSLQGKGGGGGLSPPGGGPKAPAAAPLEAAPEPTAPWRRPPVGG